MCTEGKNREPRNTSLAERSTARAAPPVTIEVFLSGGLPAFTIVGMAETAVRESKDRVRGALLELRLRVSRNSASLSVLAPAEMKKTGGRYDLAIALGILAAQAPVSKRSCSAWCTEVYGELSLGGELRAGAGNLLPAALSAAESAGSHDYWCQGIHECA